jgi:hypothetical protein
MASAPACPKCGYVRKAGDTAPAWQCPSCHIAIEKFRASLSPAAAAPAQAAPAAVPPQLPLGRRLGSALPDLFLAALFLWCWMKPGAWRASLPADLGLLMLMEFFVIHSSIFLVAAGGAGSAGARLTTIALVVFFYMPVAGAFAWWHGGWWPVLGFAALLTSRVATMLAGQGNDAFEAKRGQYYWVNAGGAYILAALLAILLLPLPELGFKFSMPQGWGQTWKVKPHEVMAWGFLYFAVEGALKALERPEWIAQWGQKPPEA